MKLTHLGAAAALLLAAAGSHAQAWLDVYAPPANHSALDLSNGGQVGVSYDGVARTNVLLPTSPGTWAAIPGNSPASGFGGIPGISADGGVVGLNGTAANGHSQAALYNVASGQLSTLGSLGYRGTVLTNGLYQQSWANGISPDGQVVYGVAYHNTTGDTASRLHPVVFRNGQVIDLNPSATSQNGAAISSNADGSLIGGYLSNSSIGRIWRWNGSAYEVAADPTINSAAGAPIGIQAAAISSDGRFVAGGSVNGLATNYGDKFDPIVFSPATLWDMQTMTGKLIPYDHVIDTSLGSTDLLKNMKTTIAGVSDDGVAIGSFVVSAGGTTSVLQADAWIYDDRTGVSLSFDNYLASLGLGLAPTQHVWNLYAMSPDGQAISGVFYDSVAGTSSGFILHLAPVPEPGSLALFATALPLVALRAMRRRRQQANT